MVRHCVMVLVGVLAVALAGCGESDDLPVKPIVFMPTDSILTPGDPILAIDLDPPASSSDYRAFEGPSNVLDGIPTTKYYNYAGANSGLIVTPQFGATIVQSLQLTTANDLSGRDPASFELYGTNDPITSTDNSTGMAENWTLVDSGPLTLPDTRLAVGPVVPIANYTAFLSYKLVFPEVKVGGGMQIADLGMFQSGDGTGANVLAPGDAVLAVHIAPESSYPPIESPLNAIDNDVNTKYLNYGETNSGFIVTPSVGPTIVKSLQMTTANDAVNRDPSWFELYGTNDRIKSADNSRAMGERWTLIDSDSLYLPSDRRTAGPVIDVNNSTVYRSYLFVVTDVKDSYWANSMQFSEIQFSGLKPE